MLLWPVDALAVTVALFLPLSVAATPLLMATVGDGHEAKVLKQWTVTTWPTAFGVAVLGLLLWGLGAYVLCAAAGARAGLVRLLIASREGGRDAEVVELVRSRARLVDAFEAERRRIERDLHDGAQQRLVALSMALGLARLDAPPGPLADQLARAHEEAGKALAELRELIRASTPRSSRTTAFRPRSPTPPTAARSPSTSTSNCRAGRPRRSSPRRTSWSARRWPTSPGTAGPAVRG